MLLLVITTLFCVHAQMANYQKYTSCINNPKFELTKHIQTGISPQECAALCSDLFDNGEGCLSFEYNENRQECRPQKKYAPNVACKKNEPGDVLYSLPNPKAPSIGAASTKVKKCAQYGGPMQKIADFQTTCEILSTGQAETASKCLQTCEENEECTEIYTDPNPDGTIFCVLAKCLDSELNSNLLQRDPKMPGRWYKCKETEDLCPVQGGGAMKADERELSACSMRDKMAAQSKKECETACLANSECTTFLWVESLTYCASMKCPPGVNAWRPDPKMPADTRYYKCKDGEVGPCMNDDAEVKRQMKEQCETMGIKKSKCPGTCSAVVKSKYFKNKPLCDRVNPYAWFPDACPFTCPNVRVNCQRSESEVKVADSCAGTSVKLGTTSDKIEGRDPLFACQAIGLEMTYPLSVQDKNVYVCCVPRSETAISLPESQVQEAIDMPMFQESTAWTFDDICLYSLAAMGLGFALHKAYSYTKARTSSTIEMTYTTP